MRGNCFLFMKLKRVFIISDDEVSNHLSAMVLQDSQNVEFIDMFTSVDEAIEILKKSSELGLNYPDLIIIHKYMKNRDAFSFLEEVYGYDNFTSKTLIISSHYTNGEVERLKKYGVIECLTRPLSLSSFQEVLNKYQKCKENNGN